MRPSNRTRQRTTWADVYKRCEKAVRELPENSPARAGYLERMAECQRHMKGRKANGKFAGKGLITIGGTI